MSEARHLAGELELTGFVTWLDDVNLRRHWRNPSCRDVSDRIMLFYRSVWHRSPLFVAFPTLSRIAPEPRSPADALRFPRFVRRCVRLRLRLRLSLPGRLHDFGRHLAPQLRVPLAQQTRRAYRTWLSGHRLFLRDTKPPAMMAAKRNMPPEITKNSSLTLMPAKVEIIL